MKNLYIILVILFLFPVCSSAQANYKAGYIVTLKGDTLQGFIDYKEWDRSPNQIDFVKQIGQATSDVYTPKNTKAFAINGLEYFEQHEVAISQGAVDLAHLSTRIDTNTKTNTVFLKILNKGQYVNLYRHTDDIKTRFYILDIVTNRVEELIYHAYYTPNEDKIQYVKRFQFQLQYISQIHHIDNKQLGRRILNANYSEDEIKKIISIINGGDSKQYSTPKLFATRWFAGGGFGISSVNFRGHTPLANALTSSTITPKIDFGIDLISNKEIQKIVFRGDLVLSVNSHDLLTTSMGTQTGLVTNEVNFTQYNITLTPQVIYKFYNTANFRAFVGGGISVNFSTYNRYQLVSKYSGFPDRVTNNYPEFEKTWISFPIKIGVVMKSNFEFSFCYVPYTVITNDVDFSGAITSYQLGVNYFFGKK